LKCLESSILKCRHSVIEENRCPAKTIGSGTLDAG
jgi:hypothetical protein